MGEFTFAQPMSFTIYSSSEKKSAYEIRLFYIIQFYTDFSFDITRKLCSIDTSAVDNIIYVSIAGIR